MNRQEVAKQPSEQKIQEYDETRRFCRVVCHALWLLAESNGEPHAHLLMRDVADFWRDGSLSFSESQRTMAMLCRDLLEKTQDLGGEELALWDQMLAEQGAPTMSMMRARHWKLVPKILKRGRIRDEDEYYLVRSVVDSSQLSEEEQTALVGLMDLYDGRNK